MSPDLALQLALFALLASAAGIAIGLALRATRRATPEETARARARLSRWILEHRLALALAIGGAGIALLGAAMFVHALAVEAREGPGARVHGESPAERRQVGAVIAIVGTGLSALGSFALRHARDA